ncbi:hypothetical protein BST28_22695 [Mycolicibacter kumamotonensis]|uniref:Uncharacterized protein n=1 Tax=Mycolicibacter kumamotonensis TaxID=354243 RepID=A0A1X0DNF0_9MYCO|nr:hypothetical protein [Mycolicibacter kumamotonensis]ORA73913.1 hypothetical protein BST28_22695 [Mycolicibacter kumamotonensis]
MKFAVATIGVGAALIAAGVIVTPATPQGARGIEPPSVALTSADSSFVAGPDGTFPQLYWALSGFDQGDADLAHGVASGASNQAELAGAEYSQYIAGVSQSEALPTMPDPPVLDSLVGQENTILENAGSLAPVVDEFWFHPLNQQWDDAATKFMDTAIALSTGPDDSGSLSQVLLDLQILDLESLPVQWLADLF